MCFRSNIILCWQLKYDIVNLIFNMQFNNKIIRVYEAERLSIIKHV